MMAPSWLSTSAGRSTFDVFIYKPIVAGELDASSKDWLDSLGHVLLHSLGHKIIQISPSVSFKVGYSDEKRHTK